MWVVDPLFRLLTSTFTIIIKYAVISLQLLERVLTKFLTPADRHLYTGKDTDTAKCINGNATDTVSPPTTPSNAKRIKRIKLLVDINISPGGSSKVVNVATTDVMDETPPSRFSQFLSNYSLIVLFVVRAIKQTLVESITPRQSRHHTVHGDTRRRTISPRRRMSQLKRVIPSFPFRLLGIREPMTDAVVIVPQYKTNGDSTDRFARAQSLEKRKRPDSTGSSDSLYEADECPLTPPAKVNGDVDKINGNCRVSPIPNGVGDEILGDPFKEPAGSDSTSSSQEYGSPNASSQVGSQLFKMLNIPEEEYESAEDPDYQPDQSSSSSDEVSSESDSESGGRKLEQEVVELQAEARAILNEELNQDVPGENENFEPQNNPVADAGVENVQVDVEENANNGNAPNEPIPDDEPNEPEYSNGQASMRELTNRPVPPPMVGVANRRVNPDDNSLQGISPNPGLGLEDVD